MNTKRLLSACATCGIDFNDCGTHAHIYERDTGEEIALLHEPNYPNGRQFNQDGSDDGYLH
jgi:hypothetical protein